MQKVDAVTHRERGTDEEVSAEDQKTDGPPSKVTVNLTPRAVVALEEALEMTGNTKTECINRALPLYTWILLRIASGDSLQLSDKDGRTREIQIF